MNFKRILVLIMTFAMVIGACAPAIQAFDGVIDGEHNHESSLGQLNYVSIGDSMANGYGFEGYAQGTDAHDFLNGVGTYGAGAYPLQIEDYFAGLGYDVNHTKLAVSALRAEDLLYLLGGRDEPADDWFDEVLYYSGMSAEELSVYYQNAVKDADVITLGVGNASFGAFMLSRVTGAIGVMGAAPDVNPEYTLENALALLSDENDKAQILEIYNKLYNKLEGYLPADMVEQYNVEVVCDIVAYTAAGFILNYSKAVDKIVELNTNENLEIVLVGLMNTTYGMEISLGGGRTIPFGTLMDEVFGVLNAYVAAYPTLRQAQGKLEGATFYYSAVAQPLFIVDALDDLAAAGWTNIDEGRLSADIIRSRTIRTYNGTLRSLIGAGFAQGVNAVIPGMVEEQVYAAYRESLMGIEDLPAMGIDVASMTKEEIIQLMIDFGLYESYLQTIDEYTNALLIADPYNFLPEITLEDVKAYDGASWTDAAFFSNSDDIKTLSVAVYLAIEDAIVESVDVDVIPADGIAAIAGDLTSLFSDFAPDTSSPDAVRETLGAFMSSEDMLPLVKIYAIFKIGDGMCVHSTPSGHDAVAAAIVKSYKEGWTAQKQTILNAYNYTVKYYDEAYELAYAYADANGYTNKVVAGINKVLNRLDRVDLSDNKMTNAFRADLERELDAIAATLNELKDVVATDKAADVPGLMDTLRGLKDDVKTHIKNIYALCKQAGYDVTKIVILPLLEELVALVEEYVEIIVTKIVEYIKPLLKGLYGGLKEMVEIIIKINLFLGGALDQLIAIINEVVDTFYFVYDLLLDVFGSIENALIIAGKITNLVIDYLRTAGDVVEFIKGFLINVYDIIVETYGATKDAMATAEAVYNYVVSVVKYINRYIKDAIDGAYVGDYELNKDSYYVALGDAALYVEDLAEMLHLSAKYEHLALYDDYLDAVAGADLVTVKFDNGEFLALAYSQIMSYIPQLLMQNDQFVHYYNQHTDAVVEGFAMLGIDLTAPAPALDWDKYADEETRAILSERLDAVVADFTDGKVSKTISYDIGPALADMIALPGLELEIVIEINVADLVAFALKTMVYGALEAADRVATTLNNIYAVAPDATVVITAIENPMGIFALLFGEFVPEVEEYLALFDEVIELLNLPLYACAISNPNTIFVNSNDAADIYDALNVHCAHYYINVCTDTVCAICGEVRVAPGHVYGEWVVVLEPTTEAEGTKEHTCTVCGYVESESIAKLDPVVPGPGGDDDDDNKDDDKKPEEKKDGLSTGAIVGIAVGSIALACGVGALVYWFFVKKKAVEAAAAAAAAAPEADKKD